MDGTAVVALTLTAVGFLAAGYGHRNHPGWEKLGVVLALVGLVLQSAVCLQAVNAPLPYLLALGPTVLAFLVGRLFRRGSNKVMTDAS